MLGNPLTLGACVHSEQETSARILASSRTNPPPRQASSTIRAIPHCQQCFFRVTAHRLLNHQPDH